MTKWNNDLICDNGLSWLSSRDATSRVVLLTTDPGVADVVVGDDSDHAGFIKANTLVSGGGYQLGSKVFSPLLSTVSPSDNGVTGRKFSVPTVVDIPITEAGTWRFVGIIDPLLHGTGGLVYVTSLTTEQIVYAGNTATMNGFDIIINDVTP